MVAYALVPLATFAYSAIAYHTLAVTPYDWVRIFVIVMTVFIAGALCALAVHAERLRSPTWPARLLFIGMTMYMFPSAYALSQRLGEPEPLLWYVWPALVGLVLMFAALIAMWFDVRGREEETSERAAEHHPEATGRVGHPGGDGGRHADRQGRRRRGR